MDLSIGDIVVIVIIAGAIIMAIRYMIRNKKTLSCGGDCSQCTEGCTKCTGSSEDRSDK